MPTSDFTMVDVRKRVKKKQCVKQHICQNEGSPCFHQKSKEEEEKKEEFSLYPNAYYPPGSLGVDYHADILEKLQLQPNPMQIPIHKEPTNIQEDVYGFGVSPTVELATPRIKKQLSFAGLVEVLNENIQSGTPIHTKSSSVDCSEYLERCPYSNPAEVTSADSPAAEHNCGKHPSKLKRRKACYEGKKNYGRSRSLTHIDNLDPAMLLRNEDMDSRSEPDTSRDQLLDVPNISGEARENKRKKLARSQVSSSEFFSISFEGELGTGHEEFFPVTRGTCLGDILRPLLEKKNINITNVNVFVDSSKTPLPSPASTDTYFVAGKTLTIKVKDPTKRNDHKFHSHSFKQPSRKSSTTSRPKHKFFSSSTEDPNNCSDHSTLGSSASLDPSTVQNSHGHGQLTGSFSHDASLKVKSTTKQSTRWSGLFSNSLKDNSKMDLLVEQLNTYSEYGTPKPNFLPSADENEALYSIEKDWKCIVGNWSELSERSVQQQTAIWELVETEVIYLRTIKVITDLFLACLYNLQAVNILNEIDRDQLFSNVPEIYKSNQILWLDCILPMVQKARNTNQPMDPNDLGNGFLQFGTTCQPYTKYCLDQTKCQRYCREKYQENEFFKTYLAWCETRKECNRLRLMDILVRPMQRMTKYSLLLKAILKHTEDLEQRKCLEEMIISVEKFVRSVNGALRNRQDADKLKGIAERIEAYDVVETREDELESLVKSHSKLDLFQPMPGCFSRRWLIYDVDLKIKDAFTSKMDAHCFIFTDMVLICKPVGRKGERMKVIRQPYIVDRLVLKELNKDPCSFGLVYLNEYGTASAALSLHFNEPKLVKVTMDHIKKTQKIYNEVKEKEHLEFREGDEETVGILYLNHHHLGGSSRASQLSSLVHSHSGSVEMNEASVLSSQAVSFEHDLRGSSLSSDDGNANESGGVNLVKSRSLSTETGRPTSPRRERRLFLSKSPSPNTLTIQIPIPNLSGQSLPNLSSASDSSIPAYSHHSLTVPKSLLSPTHRGVSYPPPSPRSLTRSYALLQSRNPPLQKSKNIVGPANPEKTVSLDVQVPEIRGMMTSERDHTGEQLSSQQFFSAQQQQHNNVKCNPELRRPKEFIPTAALDEHGVVEPDYRFTHYDSPSTSDPNQCNMKRLARNERPDSKRYFTAGAIEDIKKETTKDAAIHKRLSWNYGPHQQQQQQLQQQQSLKKQYEVSMPQSTQFFCNESMNSVRSSSGVSSTSSLFNCISDMESTSSSVVSTNPFLNTNATHYAQNISGNVQQVEQPSSTKQLPLAIAVCEPGESDRTTILYNNNSNNKQLELQEISDHIKKHFVEGSPCENCTNHHQQQQQQQQQQIVPTQRRTLSNPNPIPISSAGGQESNSCLSKLRDLVLNDSTIQTSDV